MKAWLSDGPGVSLTGLWGHSPNRRPVVAVVVAAVVGLVALAVTWAGGPDGTGSDLEGLDPETAAFVRQHDAVASRLAEERDAVAARVAEQQESSPEVLLQLEAALAAARNGYAEIDAPPWLSHEVAAYLDALDAEAEATVAGYAALRSRDDVRDALRAILHERTTAENLQRAIRRTATARDTPR